MFRIRNPFKKRDNKKREKGLGELAWKSINLENEPLMAELIKKVKVT